MSHFGDVDRKTATQALEEVLARHPDLAAEIVRIGSSGMTMADIMAAATRAATAELVAAEPVMDDPWRDASGGWGDRE